MQAADRLLEIEGKCGATIQKIVPLELDGETLRVLLYLKDGSNQGDFPFFNSIL